MSFKYILLLLVTASCISSCTDKVHTTHVDRAFYFWQNTSYRLQSKEAECLYKDSVQKLYVKFFEVEADENLGNIPVAKSELHINAYDFMYGPDSIYNSTVINLMIVPVIYIRNTIFVQANRKDLDTLADNIVFLTNKIFKERYTGITKTFSEIQIDCDWTPSTKENYFYLLTRIKTLSGKSISVTLRLYPYKYPDKMGIPPADKAMLMCYNLNNPLSKESENTILETEELKKYLKNVKKYPLHLDVALPVFSWMHIYKNNVFSGFIQTSKSAGLKDIVKEIKPHWYVVQKDFLTEDNILLKAGDKLKLEEITAESIHTSIAAIQQHVPLTDTTTVSLFHLNPHTVTNYSHEEITSFYSDFTK
jgi:hypothetical protein